MAKVSALAPAGDGGAVPFGAFAEAVSKAPTVRPRGQSGRSFVAERTAFRVAPEQP